ncbi:MAG: hypothetical protein KDB26_06325 [Microthrixaceae bacterium]|nr:hypothetical protein [Microthrixaceae bacterium]
MSSSAGTSPDNDRISGTKPAFERLPMVPILAVVSAIAVGLANANGISIGDDGVGYRAIADSLLAGDGLGYFLERPVTVWPPLWPALMAFVAKVTPLDTVGAAILLNCLVAALIVFAGNRLLRLITSDPTLILMGTAVLAIGPATVGLGHVLMTDMAFALVVIVWMTLLIKATSARSLGLLIGAAAFSWLGFGLRYVGLTLIAIGGLWLLLQHGRPFLERLRDGIIYGVVACIVPVAWMVRNYSIDETFTGERHTSARGLIDNGFDIAATIGRFILPGVLNEQTKPWAAVGILATGLAVVAVWRILADNNGSSRPTEVITAGWRQLGTPVGLVGTWTVLYLVYMLYVRTTTALNQLDLRLLFPAYFTTIFMGIVIAERGPRIGVEIRRARVIVGTWMAANVVAGLIAMVAFGMGHPFFTGDYQSDTFREVRANPVLAAIPPGCETYSNLPNALYPRLNPRGWSPQRTALESIDPVDDLERIEKRSKDHETCLVWIDEQPVYGHLWTLDQLKDRLTLTKLGQNDSVSVFRVTPGSTN